MGRNTRLQQWIDYRIRVTIQDTRTLVGTFLAFDRHMNICLADTEEFRKIKVKGSDEPKEIKRTMGLVMLRGENIICLAIEAPPSATAKKPGEGPVMGPGRGQPAGRGIPMRPAMMIPPGLSGPVRGVGGPAPAKMMPQMPGMPMMGRGMG